jgi:hypothetical protein
MTGAPAIRPDRRQIKRKGKIAMSSGSGWALGGLLQQRTVEITPSQLLHLAEAPIALVGGPGAGAAVVVLAVIASLEFNSVAYAPSPDGGAGSTSCSVCYNGPARLPALANADLSAVVTSAASALEILSGILSVIPRPQCEALEIVLCNPQTIPVDFTAGNSSLSITVFYLIAPL